MSIQAFTDGEEITADRGSIATVGGRRWRPGGKTAATGPATAGWCTAAQQRRPHENQAGACSARQDEGPRQQPSSPASDAEPHGGRRPPPAMAAQSMKIAQPMSAQAPSAVAGGAIDHRHAHQEAEAKTDATAPRWPERDRTRREHTTTWLPAMQTERNAKKPPAMAGLTPWKTAEPRDEPRTTAPRERRSCA